jgi:hypothetical protein
MEAAPVGRSVLNLAGSHGLSGLAGQSKHLCNYEQIIRIPSQLPPGVTLVREMRQESKTLFQQGTCPVTRQCNGRLEKSIEHGRTSEKIGRRNILPTAYRRNYVVQKLGETLKYRRRNELSHITECAP